MKDWTMALGLMVTASSGCAQIVLDPMVDQETQVAGSYALVMRVSEWQARDPESAAENVLLPEDPDAVAFFFSNYPQECEDPIIHPPNSCSSTIGVWQHIIAIPPELNRPGVINLTDPRAITALSWWENPCFTSELDDLGRFSGTLEIVGGDATSVSVKLSSTPQHVFWEHVDGDYTATNCSEAPLP